MDIKAFKEQHLAAQIEKIEAALAKGETGIFCRHALFADVAAHYEALGWRVKASNQHGSDVVLYFLDPAAPAVPEMKQEPRTIMPAWGKV